MCVCVCVSGESPAFLKVGLGVPGPEALHAWGTHTCTCGSCAHTHTFPCSVALWPLARSFTFWVSGIPLEWGCLGLRQRSGCHGILRPALASARSIQAISLLHCAEGSGSFYWSPPPQSAAPLLSEVGILLQQEGVVRGKKLTEEPGDVSFATGRWIIITLKVSWMCLQLQFVKFLFSCVLFKKKQKTLIRLFYFLNIGFNCYKRMSMKLKKENTHLCFHHPKATTVLSLPITLFLWGQY